MDAWDGWPFARVYMLLVALAFVIGLQVPVSRGRGRKYVEPSGNHRVPNSSVKCPFGVP
jgi:hypothetical protein